MLANAVTPVAADGTPFSAANPFPTGDLGRWGAPSAAVPVFDDNGVNTALKNLANAALQVSLAIDNSVTRYQFVDLALNVRGAVAFSSGGTLDVWILPSLDGTNYEDGSASITPARMPDAYVYMRNVSTAQLLVVHGIQVPPAKFKLLVRNSGGQALTNTNAENVLNAYFH